MSSYARVAGLAFLAASGAFGVLAVAPRATPSLPQASHRPQSEAAWGCTLVNDCLTVSFQVAHGR
ncbi:hypothetical protein [Alloyangia mangrovi]|uniref:hypothetical protein n=1 Tax=Alloyangia mangrovi TaxID=1779329 RepID=UPI0021A3DE91|nr:hypothetical protein [Alloyangia mangrovi]